VKGPGQWKGRVSSFLFSAETDDWLSYLRIGMGLQVLLYALSLQHDWNYLFGGADEGLNGRALAEALLAKQSPFVPTLGWWLWIALKVGLPEGIALALAWWGLVGAGCALILGLFSRFAAIAAWVIHLCAAKSGGFLSYGVDSFTTIGLFYLMLSPLPDRSSLDRRWRNIGPKDPQLIGFFRRVLQMHLCIIYLTSGLAKCLGSGWWDGSNLWRALIRPPFNVLPPEFLIHWRYFFPVAGIFVCLLETGYPVLIWNRHTRLLCLTCICAMHALIGVAMGMYLFALIMVVLNLAAFAPPPGHLLKRKRFSRPASPDGLVSTSAGHR
jgi:hypothetical protein